MTNPADYSHEAQISAEALEEEFLLSGEVEPTEDPEFTDEGQPIWDGDEDFIDESGYWFSGSAWTTWLAA